MKLTSENVENIFMDCLFKDEEIIDGKPAVEPCIVDGIINKYGLHPSRLENHSNDIITMLSELPNEFSKGGGWSFLNACNTKDGNQWTDFHARMEQLFVLGIAIKKVKYLMPKELWSVLPGGMPYLQIID